MCREPSAIVTHNPFCSPLHLFRKCNYFAQHTPASPVRQQHASKHILERTTYTCSIYYPKYDAPLSAAALASHRPGGRHWLGTGAAAAGPAKHRPAPGDGRRRLCPDRLHALLHAACLQRTACSKPSAQPQSQASQATTHLRHTQRPMIDEQATHLICRMCWHHFMHQRSSQ